MDSVTFHIGEAARRLSFTPKHIRVLESEGLIPPARRDYCGRIYTEFGVELLRAMGVGSRPTKLKRVEGVLGGVR
jgi:DNA-binding transcriptional MerR regulator